MRLSRLKADVGEAGVYHCMSRVAGGLPMLNEEARGEMVRLLGRLGEYSEVEVLTYCMMPNHFHLLVRVPTRRPAESFTDEEIVAKLEAFHGRKAVPSQLARAAVKEGAPIPEKIRERVLTRMREVSGFMAEFKQRVTRWYNRRHDRYGFLWGERFRSVMVEDTPEVLRLIAAYIDLNPVRAGLVADPGKYAYGGYAAALGGVRAMRKSLTEMLGAKDWPAAAAAYRALMGFSEGGVGKAGRGAAGKEAAGQEPGSEAPVSVSDLLRRRIRHMTDGVFLGSEAFVNAMWERHREKFDRRRKSGARPIRGAELPGLRVLRNLRVRAVE
ncbi:MAG: transposase [Verrucomicrobiae bacterium]|nr:transposase [Verrucomicrobiae bacterium]